MLTYTAFEGFRILSHGRVEQVVLAVRKRQKDSPQAPILIFSDASGKQMDFDLSGTEKAVLERLKIYTQSDTPPVMGPGRPKLGVICREVSLLPQHWEWLSTQEGGASATLRRLIDEKLKAPLSDKNRVKQAQETVYRFLTCLAGDLPDFEDVIRYLYRRDKGKFAALMAEWPRDVVAHTLNLAEPVFSKGPL